MEIIDGGEISRMIPTCNDGTKPQIQRLEDKGAR